MKVKRFIFSMMVVTLSLISIPLKEAFAHAKGSNHKIVLKSGEEYSEEEFENFIAEIRKEALQQGISEKTIHTYLTGLKLQPEPIKKIHHQTHKQLTFEEYLRNFIASWRLVEGQDFYKKNGDVLEKIERTFHVPPEILTAIFGIESAYGKRVGETPMIETLATLAFQKHRSTFFHDQLLAALKILDTPNITPEAKLSTYDGGMGLPQFEPTTYLNYAVDFEGKGYKDIWTSVTNALASTANYLHRMGWNGSQSWGIEVKVPKDIPMNLANNLQKKLTMDEWNKLGVRTVQGNDLSPKLSPHASLLLPDGTNGRAFLVFDNFKVLLKWNNIHYEALSIGILANKIALT